ncbi:hypothetical protein, partial [Oryzibacter oryziterrae]|uniref:hypothetical protein n=1 Tax=Oryzibacter oryziterrae TaxID=2766474 RepID=UPI001F3F77FF
GWLGVGWSLKGVPEINRVSKGKGTPWFDGDLFAPDKTVSTLAVSTDVFMLGDDELTPCNEGGTNKAWPTTDSASCSKDGLGWVNKIDDHRQIRYELDKNDWVVRDPDGTTYVFQSVGRIQNKTLPATTDTSYELQRKLYFNARWLLTKVYDTHVDATGAPANVVSYSYSCEDYLACRVTKISWKSAGEREAGHIEFVWEDRPDPFSDATGLTLADYRFRLGAVEVTSGVDEKFNPLVAKVYRLGYEIGAETGRSRLLTVTPYGSDATADQVVDTSVSPAKRSVSPANGTALKPYTFDYQEGNEGYKFVKSSTQGLVSRPESDKKAYFYGDIDGDYKTDFAEVETYNGTIIVPTCSNSAGDTRYNCPEPAHLYRGWTEFSSNTFKREERDGFGDFAFYTTPDYWTDPRKIISSYNQISDINQNGSADIFSSKSTDSSKSWSKNTKIIDLANPKADSSLISCSGSTGSSDGDTCDYILGDFTGDGIIDQVSDHQNKLYYGELTDAGALNFSKSTPVSIGILHDLSLYNTVFDPNGDGSDDILNHTQIDYHHASPEMNLYLFNRSTNIFEKHSLQARKDDFAKRTTLIGDYNGDGKSDILRQDVADNETGGYSQVFVSNGSGDTNSAGQGFANLNYSYPSNYKLVSYEPIVADFNNDGRTDRALMMNVPTELDASKSELAIVVFYSRGDRFVRGPVIRLADDEQTYRRAQVGDYNGDGQPDLYSYSGVYVRQGGVPDLLTSVTTPLGGSMTIAYAPSSDPAVTSSTPADMPFVTQVVRSITTDSAP